MAVWIVVFDGRGGAKVCEVIQRSPRTARVESLRRTGEKAEQICFRETVKVDDEIKLSSPNVFNQTENTNDRKRFEAVAQSDAVNNQRVVRITGQVDNFGAGLSNGVTQFDSPSALTAANIDGAPYGSLTGVSVDDQGYVTALFDNGIEKRVFKIPLATFVDPDALAPVAGNAYQLTDASGNATVLEAKTGGAGAISSNALEASTVDLATEFSDLITTQRAYSAATRIITTADQMLQELMQIKQ